MNNDKFELPKNDLVKSIEPIKDEDGHTLLRLEFTEEATGKDMDDFIEKLVKYL